MIDWLIRCADEDPDVARGAPPEGLLSLPEISIFEGLRCAKRRHDWLLGRWTAKQLVRATAWQREGRHIASSEIAILAAQDGAPEVWFYSAHGLRQGAVTISISHAHGVAICAASRSVSQPLGVDVEAITSRHARFVPDYFSEDEQDLVYAAPQDDRDCMITAIWSGKEAALKAIRKGLRLDTRTISCLVQGGCSDAASWHPFTIEWRDHGQFPPLRGWWRTWDKFVLTVVSGAAL